MSVKPLVIISILIFITFAYLDVSITYRKASHANQERNFTIKYFWQMLGKDITLIGVFILESSVAVALYAFRKHDYIFPILFSMTLLFLSYLHYLGWSSWL